MAAALYFQNAISPPSAAGIVLVIGGAAAYAIVSARASKADAQTDGTLGSQAPHQAEAHALLEGEDSKSEGDVSPETTSTQYVA